MFQHGLKRACPPDTISMWSMWVSRHEHQQRGENCLPGLQHQASSLCQSLLSIYSPHRFVSKEKLWTHKMGGFLLISLECTQKGSLKKDIHVSAKPPDEHPPAKLGKACPWLPVEHVLKHGLELARCARIKTGQVIATSHPSFLLSGFGSNGSCGHWVGSKKQVTQKCAHGIWASHSDLTVGNKKQVTPKGEKLFVQEADFGGVAAIFSCGLTSAFLPVLLLSLQKFHVPRLGKQEVSSLQRLKLAQEAEARVHPAVPQKPSKTRIHCAIYSQSGLGDPRRLPPLKA